MENRKIPTYLLMSMLFFFLVPSLSVSAKNLHNDVEVGKKNTTQLSMEFDISVPWIDLRFEDVVIDGESFVNVTAANMENTSQIGAPSLPFLNKAYGVPHGVDIKITTTPGKAHTIRLRAPVLPSPTTHIEREIPENFNGENFLFNQEMVFERELMIYSGKKVYPESFSQILNDGSVRQQRIISVGFFPFQFDPTTNQLIIYESFHVLIEFEGVPEIATLDASADARSFEKWFSKSLENYELAKGWRVAKEDLRISDRKTEENSLIDSPGWTPPNPGWRVKINEKGFYRISYLELQTVGFPVDTVDPAKIQMYNQGEEIAIMVTGNGDSFFDSDEMIIFYGKDILSKYSGNNAYWLTFGNTSGIRMPFRASPPSTAESPESFTKSVTFEENHYYLTGTPGDDSLERFLWGYIYATSPNVPKSWSTNIYISFPRTDQISTLRLDLLGYLAVTTNPDHHVTVSLNGQHLGESWWDGATWQNVDFEIPIGVLLHGNNNITVTCPNDTGYGRDLVYIDKINMTYRSNYQTQDDELVFKTDTFGTWKFLLDGFTSSELSIFDVTQPTSPVRIIDFSINGSEAPYTLSFEETIDSERVFWSGSSETLKTVQEIKLDNPSNLQSEDNTADYILITHSNFIDEAEILVNLRLNQGYRSVIVDIQDVYDEFNFGVTDASAIHDFLLHAYTAWQSPSPSYVVLLGDGNYDPKNYLNYGRESYIPPFLAAADPWINETVVDNRYVTLIGTDTMPDLMLGRLSVEDEATAASIIQKIVYYEQHLTPSDWRHRILAITDNADGAGDFPMISDLIISEHIPSTYDTNRVYYGGNFVDVPAARTAIQNGINNGALFINYIGHGQYVAWAEEQLFTNPDVNNLNNENMFPVVLSMTCYDGFFHRPGTTSGDYRSLAEVVTRAENKGAVASWSPSGLGVASGHDILNSGFYDAIFLDRLTTIGEATFTGKFKLWMSGGSQDLLDTFLLFGDPAMNIGAFNDYYLPMIVR